MDVLEIYPRKIKKVLCIIGLISGKFDVFGNFILQIEPIMERFPRVKKFKNFINTVVFGAQMSESCYVI